MDFYNPLNKVVVAGDIVYASDLNSINTSVDVGFSQVELELTTIKDGIASSSIGAQGWAAADQGVRPNFELDLYSAKAYAIEAKGWTQSDGTVLSASTGVEIVGSASAKTYAAQAAASAGSITSAATTSVTASAEAIAASAKAKKWASNDIDVVVEDGLYSAYHWARLAGGNGGLATFFSGVV